MHIQWSKLAWILGAAICFVVATTAYQTRAQCISNNKGRVQGNIRAQVLREFLTDAAKARFVSAAHETGAVAKSDFQTAKHYNALRDRVKDLPMKSCL